MDAGGAGVSGGADERVFLWGRWLVAEGVCCAKPLGDVGLKAGRSCTLRSAITPPLSAWMTCKAIVGTWLSLVERTLGVGEVASSNLVVPTIYFQLVTGGK